MKGASRLQDSEVVYIVCCMHMAWDAEGQKVLGIIWCMVVLIGLKYIFGEM